MARGMSIHIGVNRVDPAHYGGPRTLLGCENDAREMSRIASRRGYEVRPLLLSEGAKIAAVRGELSYAAKALYAGDILLLTFSGHGGTVPDDNHDERFDTDQTWCLYDEELVDDEIYGRLADFRRGVRVVVVSDSCFSGNILWELLTDRVVPDHREWGRGLRGLHPDVAARTYRRNRARYDEIQTIFPHGRDVRLSASVLLMAACLENETARDGEANGLFTEELLRAWKEGRFDDTYFQFFASIADAVNQRRRTQRPWIQPDGPDPEQWITARPFEI